LAQAIFAGIEPSSAPANRADCPSGESAQGGCVLLRSLNPHGEEARVRTISTQYLRSAVSNHEGPAVAQSFEMHRVPRRSSGRGDQAVYDAV